MMSLISKSIDRFLGRGKASIAVPVMDGALKPNTRLDQLETKYKIDQVDNLIVCQGKLFASSADRLLCLEPTVPLEIAKFDVHISALAASEGGKIAVGLENGKVLVSNSATEAAIQSAERIEVACPTALHFLAEDKIAMTSGSTQNSPGSWRKDLMTHGASGRVSIWTPSRLETLPSSLRWPCGISVDGEGQLIISEAWAHRLVRVDPDTGKVTETAVSRLPGYPGRIVSDGEGGYWLCLFAPRNQLVEFALSEREYTERMINTIDEALWISPQLRAGKDFQEALQGGGVRQMGVLKPWSPSLSYGLVVRLDADLAAIESLHSRADGHAHGTTSVALTKDNDAKTLWIAAKGDEVVLSTKISEV